MSHNVAPIGEDESVVVNDVSPCVKDCEPCVDWCKPLCSCVSVRRWGVALSKALCALCRHGWERVRMRLAVVNSGSSCAERCPFVFLWMRRCERCVVMCRRVSSCVVVCVNESVVVNLVSL
jgi:hypothetical protein